MVKYQFAQESVLKLASREFIYVLKGVILFFFLFLSFEDEERPQNIDIDQHKRCSNAYLRCYDSIKVAQGARMLPGDTRKKRVHSRTPAGLISFLVFLFFQRTVLFIEKLFSYSI